MCNVVPKKQSLVSVYYFKRSLILYVYICIIYIFAFSYSRKFYRHERSVEAWKFRLREKMSPWAKSKEKETGGKH